jgi:hypothetical protein
MKALFRAVQLAGAFIIMMGALSCCSMQYKKPIVWQNISHSTTAKPVTNVVPSKR